MSQVVRPDTIIPGWGNRGSLEIINLMLLACMNSAIKTHVMYRCNLNSKQVQVYLELLLKLRLVEKLAPDDASKRELYKTTDRGMKFVKAYADLSEAFGSAEEELQSLA